MALACACAASFGLAACSDTEGLAQACEPLVPAADLSVLPEGISLDDYGTVVRARKSNGFVGARAVAEDEVDELYTPLLNLLKDGGYEIVGEDNEGFEAEIFFTRDRNTGSLILRRGECEGETNIMLTYGA
ncbi:MAG: hypothetical protein ACRDJL_02450 [Actinomycetota bacterium]